MTTAQAEKKARQIWGKRWAITVQDWACPSCRYAVGYTMMGMFMPRGQGSTWEEAFRAAENRKESTT